MTESWNEEAIANQDIPFFIKCWSSEFFGEDAEIASSRFWVGRKAKIPKVIKKCGYADYANERLREGYYGAFVWFHENKRAGEFGKGLTALVRLGPMNAEREAEIIAVDFVDCEATEDTLRRKFLKDHKSLRRIHRVTTTFTWTIDDTEVNDLLEVSGIGNSCALNDDSGFVDLDRSFVEGQKFATHTVRSERSAAARNACIAALGCSCIVCGFNFEEVYGERGKGFIHVHHLNPLAQGEQKTDPAKDLVPVCPNCHYMLHRGDLLGPDELKTRMGK